MKRPLGVVVTILLALGCFLADLQAQSPEQANPSARRELIKSLFKDVQDYGANHSEEESYAYAETRAKAVGFRFVRPDSPQGRELIKHTSEKLDLLKREGIPTNPPHIEESGTSIKQVSYNGKAAAQQPCAGGNEVGYVCTVFTFDWGGHCTLACTCSMCQACNFCFPNYYSVTSLGCTDTGMYIEWSPEEGYCCGC